MSKFALEMFPVRVRKRKIEAFEPSADHPQTGFNPLKDEAVVPVANNAYSRTLRRHEALHAIYSPVPESAAKLKVEQLDLIGQALEDARLHLLYSKAEGAVRDDEVYTALSDLRSVQPINKDAPHDKAAADYQMLTTIRSAAILQGADTRKDAEPYVLDALGAMNNRRRVTRANDLYRAINKCFELIQKGKMSEARDAIGKYFYATKQEVEKLQIQMAAQQGSGAAKYGGWQYNQAFSGGGGGFGYVPGETEDFAANLLPPPLFDKIVNDARHEPRMKMINLAATRSKPTAKDAPTEKLMMSGMRIRAKKLALALLPSPPRLFTKKRKGRDGGTVLIDASGSMHISQDQLMRLAETIPAGTVAFYDGNDDGIGRLVIYADKNRVFDNSQGGFPGLQGGNAVDYPALKWLLAQPEPRWIVTDGGFCGCHETFVKAATALLDGAIKRKMVKHCGSMKAAQEMVEHWKVTGKLDPDEAETSTAHYRARLAALAAAGKK